MKNLGKFLIFIGLSYASIANALELKLFTDPSTPGVNTSFRLILEVTKTAKDNVDSVSPPDFGELEFFGKSSQTSEQISTVNGKLKRVSKSKLLFELAAKKEGSYIVKPFTVTGTSGKVYKTEPYAFNVAKKASGSSPQNNMINPFGATGSLFDSFFRRSVPSYDPRYDDLPDDKKSFIDVQVNKAKVYEGEQIKVSWWLYTIGSLRNINTLQYPGLGGFWKEDTELRTRLDFDPVSRDGIQYNKALLSSSSLFPLKSGISTIDEYQSKISVSLPGRFSYSRSQSSIVSSPPIDIEVIPLPSPIPLNFAYGVGAFSLKGSTDSLKAKQNEPFNIVLKFEGYGNAKVIEIEKLIELPEGLSVYDVNERTQFFKNGTSYKLFDIAILPAKEGEFEIPEMKFSFFDPDLEEYYDLVTPEKILVVEENKSNVEGVASESYIKELDSAENKSELSLALNIEKPVWHPPKWLWLFINALLFVIVLLTFIYKKIFAASDRGQLSDIVNDYLEKIEGHKSNNNMRAFGTEINSAIEFIIGKSTLEGSSSYEMKRLIKASSPRLQREYGEKLSELRQKAELLAFAPEEQANALKSSQNMDSLYEETRKILLSSCKIIEGH